MSTFTGEVHPVADLFPMLADDELADLADDIAARGLLQPIVLDPEGRLLDGRNRLAACEKAGVEPTFTVYDGDDPGGYALAVNIARRQMTKGQSALVIARAYTQYTHDEAAAFGVSKQYVSWARKVSKMDDLRAAVFAGGMSLTAAYEAAIERERITEAIRAKRTRLDAGAPDLAALVDEERMSLDDAIAALAAREAEAAREVAEEAARLEEQEQREHIAHQQALGRWSEFNDHVVAALSWTKTYQPPDGIPDNFPSIDAVTDRLRELGDIADTWKE